MTPERWQEIERLYHTALPLAPAERVAWLGQVCAGDAGLRREVESLLAQSSQADAFMEAPALVFAAREFANESRLSLMGSTFGSYTLLSLLGSGGMGDVYRAHDTTLERDVALKFLPGAFASDPDRLARFTREARTLAALNHPNIAAIYGIEESGGVRALVMEFVDGEDLSALIERGAVPLADALPIARQIAEALEAAHEQGIIHRDLKPANINVRADGTVKVLDFGLAKAMDPPASADTGAKRSSMMNSPTLTQHGLILGTAAYMSPEQAKGRTVDKRTDIWSFGVVLYEMLAGQRAFGGDDVTETLAAVLRDTPAFEALPASTPARLRRILERCIERDPKARLRDIGEARVALARIANGDADEVAPRKAVATTAPPSVWWRGAAGLLTATAFGVLITLGAIGVLHRVNREGDAPIYASLDAPPDHVLGEDDAVASLPTRTPMAFTPDGRSLIIQAAHAGRPQLFLRSLDHPDARPIAGTDNARVPFVSPDGKWVGFWSDNAIRKVPIEGGEVATVCPTKAVLGPHGAAWGAGDVIVFGDEISGRIMRVSAGGGVPVPVTQHPPIRRRHSAPSVLPDGHRILFSDVSTVDAGDSHLMMQSLDGGDARVIVESAVDGRLVPSGRLAFMRLGTLMTAPFDLARAEVTGDATVAIGGVMQSGLRWRFGAENSAAGMFAVSSTGTLAFVRGSLIGPAGSPMIWETPDGQTTSAEPATGGAAGGRLFLRISPDRSRAIAAVTTPMHREVWLADWTRDAWTLCGECSSDSVGVWSADGARLLLGRRDTLVAHAVNGSIPDQILVQESGRRLVPANWLADGRIAYQSSPDSSNYEIKLIDAGGGSGRVIVPLGVGVGPEVSPDGRWVAYTSSQTGDREVVVQAFPGPGPRAQISAGGGFNPAWSADGRTLYYLRQIDPVGYAMVANAIVSSPILSGGKPRELFRRPEAEPCVAARCYDVSPDGPRFLLRDESVVPRASVTRMDLVVNWAATLPAGR